MRIIFMIVITLLLFIPYYLYADEDSELRAEILGEQYGKVIAGDHSEYEPAVAKEECKGAFYSKWEEHFKEKGFDTDQATVDSFIAGCMKKYNKKFGK